MRYKKRKTAQKMAEPAIVTLITGAIIMCGRAKNIDLDEAFVGSMVMGVYILYTGVKNYLKNRR